MYIPVMMPYISKYDRGIVSPTLASLRTDRRLFYLLRSKYDVNVEKILIDTGSPSEILQIFNDTILQGNVNSVVYLQVGGDTSVASTEYVMMMLEGLGIPVLSWDPKYSGALEVNFPS